MSRKSLLIKGILICFYVGLIGFGIFKVREVFFIQDIDISVSESLDSENNYSGPLLAKVEDLKTELHTFVGASLMSLPLQEMSKVLQANVLVKSFHIQRAWPSKVQISIVPKPYLALLRKDKDFYFVFEDGDLVKAQTELLPDVVILFGDEFFESKEFRLKTLKLINELPSEGVFSIRETSEVGFDSRKGYWLRLSGRGTLVYMNKNNWSDSVAKVSQVISYLDSKGIEARVIEANLSKKIVVKTRKDP